MQNDDLQDQKYYYVTTIDAFNVIFSLMSKQVEVVSLSAGQLLSFSLRIDTFYDNITF